jgi:C-terminal processing protease CtpA/Prc
MNGININQFQFEYDLTWMSFFQNHEGKTYLRYGGRNDKNPESHLNQKSLVSAMKTALAKHKSKASLEFNQLNPKGENVLVPEQNPSAQKLLAKRENKCIHCHEVKSTQLMELKGEGKLKKEMVFTYPSPETFGVEIDPIRQTIIKTVAKNSNADSAGLKTGDEIVMVNGNAVSTYADITRVLEFVDGNLNVEVTRGGETKNVDVRLSKGWRTVGDSSWRESEHVVGPNSGFWGKKLSAGQKKRMRLDEDQLGLRITVIWGAWAKKAKLKQGDVVVSLDGKTDDWSIKQLQSYLHMNKDWGDKVEIEVMRGGRSVTTTMALPKGN